jgi:Mg-chelatase subunit ChlD
MKKILWIFGIALLSISTCFAHKVEQPRIDAVFVLDSTGSMGGLIQSAKDKIWSIASTMAQATPTPKIRIGFITYRDRGDQYVTKSSPLTYDLDSVYSDLMGAEAQGGGDTPESVNQALNEAIHKMKWSQDKNTYRVVFLVGDAPPHMDYDNDVKYYLSCSVAVKRNIKINTIQCGNIKGTQKFWKEMATLGNGEYFQVEQNGGSVVVKTPYCKDISTYSQQLDEKKVYWGTQNTRNRLLQKKETQKRINKYSSHSSLAQRAEFNTSYAGRDNNEWRNDISKVEANKLLDISNDLLPQNMQKMNDEEKEKYVAEIKRTQEELEAKIVDLNKKRKSYLNKKAREMKTAGKTNFENSVFTCIRKQAKEVKIKLQDSPSL